MCILTGIPNIGPKRARNLLDRFGTIEGVLTANQEALTEAEGIGRQTAQRIHWAVHEATNPYHS